MTIFQRFQLMLLKREESDPLAQLKRSIEIGCARRKIIREGRAEAARRGRGR